MHGGVTFARYWLHNGFLSINSTKMSKSIGNVLLVHDLIKDIPGEVIRLALMSAHYRQPLDWSDATLESARRMLDRLYGALRGIPVSKDERNTAQPPAAVIAAIEDDLNTPKALAEMFNVAREINKTVDPNAKQALAVNLQAAGDLIGVLQQDADVWFAGDSSGGLTADQIDALIAEREQARAARDFAAADSIRDQLADSDVVIEDGSDGTRWRRL